MVLCKFFLQGNCKFGNSCKYEHDQGGHRNQWSFGSAQSFSSPLNLSTSTPTPQPPPAQPQTGSVDTETLVKAVATDMTAAEKGGQWLISSYSPFKEKPEFPGFEEFSFEEIRNMYYEATKGGATAVEQFKQQWQSILQSALMKVRALQNPTPDLINIVKNIYNSARSSTFTSANQFGGTPAASTNIFSSTASAPGNLFGQNPPNQGTLPPFAASTPPSGAFGQSQQNQHSVFGGGLFGNTQQQPAQPNVFSNQQGSLFGQTPQSQGQQGSIFGQTATQGQQASVFGNTQTKSQSGSIFGQASNNNQPGNLFGQVSNANQQGSIFANPAQSSTTTGNLFSPQSGLFSNPGNVQTNIFATQAPATTTSVFSKPADGPFSNQPSGNVFQANPVSSSSSSIFSAQNLTSTQSGSIFNTQNQGTSQSGSIFGQVPSQTPLFSNGSGTALNQAVSNNIFGAQPIIQQLDPEYVKTAYSKLEDLTEAEIKWFQSDELDLDNIPSKPPTYEMCI